MSAGAAGGVLEYAELPEEADARASAHRSTPFASRAGSRAMVRSGILGSSGVGASSSLASGSFRPAPSHSQSMLPYPYNLRAAATARHFGSF